MAKDSLVKIKSDYPYTKMSLVSQVKRSRTQS